MKICVIGAGSCGLTAIKACKEENLEVDCFEATDRFGGLWNFDDDSNGHRSSVMKTTTINTSKEMSAFSDFPPPEEFPNFMHNTDMLEYFRLYAEHFDLFRHIQYNCRVVNIEMSEDYNETGRWLVTVKNLSNGTFTNTYDGVMVCTGHHRFPFCPSFEGLEDFQGTVRHTSYIKTDKGYEDKRVLVVGMGNSAVDAAADICRVAKKLYLSTRRGSWIHTRLLLGGMPFDIFYQKRIFELLSVSDWLRNYCLEFLVNLKIDHEKYGLKPNHRVLSTHATVNDNLPHYISSGRIIVKQDVERFTKNGVVFHREKDATPVDDIILATGYEIKYDFLSEDIIKVERNSLDLYKLVFPDHLPFPSLGFIGLIQPLGSIFPAAEAQSRWFVQLMLEKCKLPPMEEMKAEVRSRREQLSRRFVNSPRHTIQVDFIRYMDEICAEFGAKPNLWKMAFTDPVLFYLCMTGPCVSYQYRLQGPHTWNGARTAILTVNKRIEAPFKTRKLL